MARPAELRQTHTFVEMDVSPETFAEIQQRFKMAEYNHVFSEEGDKVRMDMQGIALTTSKKVLEKKIIDCVMKPLERRRQGK